MGIVPRIADDLASVNTPLFWRNWITAHEHCSDKEQDVCHRRAWPIKPPEHHQREQHTTRDSQSVRVPSASPSGNIPAAFAMSDRRSNHQKIGSEPERGPYKNSEDRSKQSSHETCSGVTLNKITSLEKNR